MTTELITQLGYVVAAGLFIFGLKMLGSPATARRGNMISSIGMLVAIVSALLDQGIVDFTYIAAGMVVGGALARFRHVHLGDYRAVHPDRRRDPHRLAGRLRQAFRDHR